MTVLEGADGFKIPAGNSGCALWKTV